MEANFELFEEGPVGWTRERLHVTLWKGGHLYFNRWALEALGRPAGVALMFDRRRQLIGVMPAATGKRHVFPLRKKKGMGEGRMVTVKNFCGHYGIRTAEAVAFPTAQVNRDGVLVLDLQKAEAAGRKRTVNRE